MLDTTIATLATQTSFTLTTGPAEDDALNGMWAVIHDTASAVQLSWVLISDYTGSTKTVTLAAGATFTVAAKDNISVMFPSPLQPTTTGNKLVVDSAGLADASAVKVGPTGSGTAQTAGDHRAASRQRPDPRRGARATSRGRERHPPARRQAPALFVTSVVE